jgi:hypothetical protein
MPLGPSLIDSAGNKHGHVSRLMSFEHEAVTHAM